MTALTRDDLMALWRSGVDPEYVRQIEQSPEDLGLIEQAAEQLAAVSLEVDTLTQAMYIMPWSGQSAPPATLLGRARVDVEIARAAALGWPLYIAPGFSIEQSLPDYGPNGARRVLTGRRFLSKTGIAFLPGERGPQTATFESRLSGASMNHVREGTLDTIVVETADLANTSAVFEVSGFAQTLRVNPYPDLPVPDVVGWYVFLDGANEHRPFRIIAYEPPVVGIDGGTLRLAADGVVTLTGITGSFVEGDVVRTSGDTFVGTIMRVQGTAAFIEASSGTLAISDVLEGIQGGEATVASIDIPFTGTSDATVSWRIANPEIDFWLTSSNPAKPTGGAYAILEELGAERGRNHQSGETEDAYRKRVWSRPDTISPNAIRRTANRIIFARNLEICFREVGDEILFPGIFFDASVPNRPSVFDLDFVRLFEEDTGPTGFSPNEIIQQVHADGTASQGRAKLEYTASTLGEKPGLAKLAGVTRPNKIPFTPGQIIGVRSRKPATVTTVSGGIAPEHRFIVSLSLGEFRAFFLIGVPPIISNAQGFSWGDPYPEASAWGTLGEMFWTSAEDTDLERDKIYTSISKAVNPVKGGGVGFDLYVEDVGCL